MSDEAIAYTEHPLNKFYDQTEETDGDRSRQGEAWPAGKSNIPQRNSISGSFRKLVQLQQAQNDNGHSQSVNNS